MLGRAAIGSRYANCLAPLLSCVNHSKTCGVTSDGRIDSVPSTCLEYPERSSATPAAFRLLALRIAVGRLLSAKCLKLALRVKVDGCLRLGQLDLRLHSCLAINILR